MDTWVWQLQRPSCRTVEKDLQLEGGLREGEVRVDPVGSTSGITSGSTPGSTPGDT